MPQLGIGIGLEKGGPTGSVITPPPPPTNERITENSETRALENGESRILE